MVKLWPFGKKEDKDGDFQREVAIADTARPGAPTPEEYMASLGKSVYMIMDHEVSNILASDPHLANLIPALSHVNRTVKLDKRGKDLQDIRYEILLIKTKLTMNPLIYEEYGMELLDALRIYAHNIANDAYEGWKGHLVTEQIRKIITEVPKAK